MKNALGMLVTAIALGLVGGCGSDSPGDPTETDASTTTPPPPPAPTPATPQPAGPDPAGGIQSIEAFHVAIKARNPAYNGRGTVRPDSTGRIVAVGLKQTGVSDLSPLKGLQLHYLEIAGNPVTDLLPLKGMPLEVLDALQTRVSDITPLRGMPLKELYLDETAVSDLTALRGMKITKLYLNNTRIRNLAPLTGMPIEELNLVGTAATDLSALKGMPLKMLWLTGVPVSDLSALAGSPIVSLTAHRTRIKDVVFTQRMLMLQRLHIAETPVTDLKPLHGLRLTRLIFTPAGIEKGIDGIRNMPTLTELGTTFETRMRPRQFWALYDMGALK